MTQRKRENPVWDNFEVIEIEGKQHPKVKCLHCHQQWENGMLNRLKNHMAQCKNASDDLRRKYAMPDDMASHHMAMLGGDKSGVAADGTLLVNGALPVGSGHGGRKSGSLKDKITESEMMHIDNAIFEFILENELPFDMIQSPSFIEIISCLRPVYRLPTKKMLTNYVFNKNMTNNNMIEHGALIGHDDLGSMINHNNMIEP